jgi:hypothetical protein
VPLIQSLLVYLLVKLLLWKCGACNHLNLLSLSLRGRAAKTSLALGAYWQTIYKVVIPYSASGIAGAILEIGLW